MKFDVSVFFDKLSRKFTFHENMTRITATLHEDLCTFMAMFLLQMYVLTLDVCSYSSACSYSRCLFLLQMSVLTLDVCSYSSACSYSRCLFLLQMSVRTLNVRSYSRCVLTLDVCSYSRCLFLLQISVLTLDVCSYSKCPFLLQMSVLALDVCSYFRCLFLLQIPDCWLEVNIRKVLRPATSTQVSLGFPVSTSECSDGSPVSKLLLHASHVALAT